MTSNTRACNATGNFNKSHRLVLLTRSTDLLIQIS